MEEIDLAASEPKPLIGWALKTGARGDLVLRLEYGCPGEGSASLTLAIPSEAVLPLAEELARRVRTILRAGEAAGQIICKAIDPLMLIERAGLRQRPR